MPPRVSESPEVQSYYLTQAALATQLAAAIRKLWPNLDPTDLAGTFPWLRDAAAGLGTQYALAGISLAADYYDDLRKAQGVAGAFTAPTITAPTMAQFQAYIDKTAADMLASLDTLVDDLYLAEVATQLQTEIEGATQNLVADAGRGQIFAAVEADRKAKAWARVTRPGACAFCRMLATRGAVYRSKTTADFRAHVTIHGRGGTCQCTVEPLFTNYEPPAHVREDMALWDRVSAGGVTGKEAFYEFRRNVEGRADGTRLRRGGGTTSKPVTAAAQSLGFDSLTPAQLERQLSILEGLPLSDYRTAQLARVRDRLAALAA